MPYERLSDLPPAVRKLPRKKQKQWKAVFNSVFASTSDDGRASAAAWSAVRGSAGKVLEDLFSGADYITFSSLLKALVDDPGLFAGAGKCERCGAVTLKYQDGEMHITEEGINLSVEECASVSKSQVTPEGVGSSDLRLNFSITKVDDDKRLIEGIASAEVLDAQGEIMEYEGSKKAFGAWKGNVREMHQPLAVGKSVGIEFEDTKKQIRVTARISKGAEDTWTKIKDGTLNDFSIRGTRVITAIKSSLEVPKRALKGIKNIPEKVRVTSEWVMAELSVVDAGALPGSGFELVKMVDGVPTATDILESGEVPVDKKVEGKEAEKTESPETQKAEQTEEVAEKAVWSAAFIDSLPDTSFGFIEPGGKKDDEGRTEPRSLRHYPIKNASGDCDAPGTRSALSRADQQIKSGGKPAEIARKAMPKIRASAKKLRIGVFKSSVDEFLIFNDITKLGTSYEDEIEANPGEVLSRESIDGFLTKYHDDVPYFSVFESTPVSFGVAYQRYKQSQVIGELFDEIDLYKRVIINTLLDPSLSFSTKRGMVESSSDEFLDVLFDTAQEIEAARKSAQPEKGEEGEEMNEDLRKELKETQEGFAKQIKDLLNPESLTKTFEKVTAPLQEGIDNLKKTVAEGQKTLEDRLEKVEAQPAAPAKVVLKVEGKELPEKSAGKPETVVKTEDGVEKTLPELEAAWTDKCQKIDTAPLGSLEREKLEIEGFKIAHQIKVLKGQSVWTPGRGR